MTKPVDSHCRAFQLALEVLGRPWCALILNVLQGGPLRFSEIRERAQAIERWGGAWARIGGSLGRRIASA